VLLNGENMKIFYNRILTGILFFIFISVTNSSIIYSQTSGKVLFLTDTTAASWDQFISDSLKSLGYNVVINNVLTEFNARIPSDSELASYKFMFVSEAISSKDLLRLRGATVGVWETGWLPIPTVNTDNWASRGSALGFVPGSAGYGNIGGKVKIVDSTGSPLSAGFSQGTEISITSNTTSQDKTAQNNYVIPDPKVHVIPIAASVQDSTKLVVLGVEKGTAVFNSAGVINDTLKTTARYAAVGMHQYSYPFITRDGWKLIRAAINWVTYSDTITAVEKNSSLPRNFELMQNYPNPFNPVTTIQFEIPENSYIKLGVYNILGQEIALLVNDFRNAGTYSVSFNGLNVPSGVYFYRLESNGYSMVKQMLLLK